MVRLGGTPIEVLRAIARFVVIEIAAICFLIAAPALMLVVPFVLIAHGHGNDLGILAFFYMAAGPFVSAVWTAFLMNLRRVRRGGYKPFTWRAQVVSGGWMLIGFFGTVAAEVAFNLAFHAVSKSPVVYFALAPFAVFAPLVLVWARNRYAGL